MISNGREENCGRSALQYDAMEFIADNGGGAKVRLRKGHQKKS